MTLPSIGDVVDNKFRIERKLGEGGTSTIYEVRHLITEKKFAIKWLAPELAHNDLAVQLLFHEAKVSGRFVHPNAVQIYDICKTADSFYLLMEFLEGETLETRLHREHRLSVEAACDILLPCIEALSAAHRAGIVHRDLKPSNIFLCRIDGQDDPLPKVLDFGISNYVHGGVDISPTGSGTPLYMAPEQMWSQPADPKFDIYALGVVLYELISGKPPFDSDDFDDLVHMIVESKATRLDEILQVEPEFAAIVARAMARGSDDRFATMAELAAALRPFGSRHAHAADKPAASTPAKPIEGRESDVPSGPARRSSWTSTTIGFAVQHHAAMAAAKDSEPPRTRTPLAAAEPLRLQPLAAPAQPRGPIRLPPGVASAAKETESTVEHGPAKAEREPAKPQREPAKTQVEPTPAPEQTGAEPKLAAGTKPTPEPKAEPSEPVLELADLSGLLIEGESEGKSEPAIVAAPAAAKESETNRASRSSAAAASGAQLALVVPPAGTALVRAPAPQPQAAVKVTARPIAARPPRTALARADQPTNWGEDASDGKTPWNVEDVPAGLPARQRRLGVMAALGGAALLTCYALIREIEPARTTDVSPARRGAAHVAAPPVSQVASAVEPTPVEPTPAPQPSEAAPARVAAPSQDPDADDAERRLTRRNAAKRNTSTADDEEDGPTTPPRAARTASTAPRTTEPSAKRSARNDGDEDSKEFSIPTRRQNAGAESRQAPKEFSIPDTGLSRQDF